MLKGLIFDLDGVITDTAEYHYLAWKELADELGISINRAFNERLKGISRMESLDLILEYGHIEEKYTEHEKETLADKKNERYKVLIENITSEDLLPGIKELLEQASQRGLKMAIASASKNAPAILEKLEVHNYFEAVVDPSKLENGKPNPEIFEKATTLLDLKKSEVVGIEDAASGVEAINRAGIFSIGIGDAQTLSEADVVVPTTKDLTLVFIITHFKGETNVISNKH